MREMNRLWEIVDSKLSYRSPMLYSTSRKKKIVNIVLCFNCREIMTESEEVLALCIDLAGQHLECCP